MPHRVLWGAATVMAVVGAATVAGAARAERRRSDAFAACMAADEQGVLSEEQRSRRARHCLDVHPYRDGVERVMVMGWAGVAFGALLAVAAAAQGLGRTLRRPTWVSPPRRARGDDP